MTRPATTPVELGSTPALRASHAWWLAAVVCTCRLLQGPAFPIYDDAFITYRYALNLALGRGMVFNPGADWEPVLGTTTPAYSALLAVPAWLGLSIPLASVALNALADALCAFLIARLGASRPVAVTVALLAFAALPAVNRVSAGGMEAPLFALLAVGAVTAVRSGRFALAGVAAGLACTVRPEGVLLLAVLAIFEFRSWGSLLRAAAPVAAIGLAALLVLGAYYGDPIPQSVQAKASNHGLGWDVSRVLEVLQRGVVPSPEMWLGLPLAAIGLVLAFTNASTWRAVMAFGAAMLCAYALSGAKTWGWYFYVPLLAWCLALGEGAEAALSVVCRGAALPRRWLTPVGIGLGFLAVTGSAVLGRVVPAPASDGVYSAMAQWWNEPQAAEAQPSICASDIGAVGWFSGARILDSEGLVWPAAREHARQVDVVRAYRPDGVLVVVNRARMLPFLDDPISGDYEPVARFSTYGLTRDEVDLHPAREALVDGWVPDYILFLRRN
jgi:hypothetical protein